MIAKSKASEVGPAAGTYVKLQDAYYSEKNFVGGALSIGYTLPGKEDGTKTDASSTSATNNFTFTVTATNPDAANASVEWAAANISALNDCTAAKNWTVTSTTPSGKTGAQHIAAVDNADCKALTPTFDKIGK